MARLSIDEKFFTDGRVSKLSRLSGEELWKTRNRLLQVWLACYQERTHLLDEEQINLAAEWDGDEPSFLGLMVDSGLAFPNNAGDDKRWCYHIMGVRDRIQYLLDASEAGKRGAAKRWGKDRDPIGGLKGPNRVSWPIPTPTPNTTNTYLLISQKPLKNPRWDKVARTFTVSEEHWSRWVKKHPELDLDLEAKKAGDWLIRKKTWKKDYKRYLDNWFNNAEEYKNKKTTEDKKLDEIRERLMKPKGPDDA